MVASLANSAFETRAVAPVHGKTGDSATGDQFGRYFSEQQSLFNSLTYDPEAGLAALLENASGGDASNRNAFVTAAGTQSGVCQFTSSETPVTLRLATPMLPPATAKSDKLAATKNSASSKASIGKSKKSVSGQPSLITMPLEVAAGVSALPQQSAAAAPTLITTARHVAGWENELPLNFASAGPSFITTASQVAGWENELPLNSASAGPSFITTASQVAGWENELPLNSASGGPSFITTPGQVAAWKSELPEHPASSGSTFITTPREVAAWKSELPDNSEFTGPTYVTTPGVVTAWKSVLPKDSASSGPTFITTSPVVAAWKSESPTPLVRNSAFESRPNLPNQNDAPKPGESDKTKILFSAPALPGDASNENDMASVGLESKPNGAPKVDGTLDAQTSGSATSNTQASPQPALAPLPSELYAAPAELISQTPGVEVVPAEVAHKSSPVKSEMAWNSQAMAYSYHSSDDFKAQPSAEKTKAPIVQPTTEDRAAWRTGGADLIHGLARGFESKPDAGSKVDGMPDAQTSDSAGGTHLPRIPRSDELTTQYTAKPEISRTDESAGESNQATDLTFAARIQDNSSAIQPQSNATQPTLEASPHGSSPDRPEATPQIPGEKTVPGEEDRKSSPVKTETAQNSQAMPYAYSSRDDFKAQTPPAPPSQPATQVEMPPAQDEPAKLTTPLKDVTFQMTQSSEKVEIRIVQEAGEVRVAVRAGDTDLVHGLRQDLSDLSGKLQQGGYHADTWRPGAATEAMSSGNDPRKGSGDSGNGQPQSGGSQHDRGQQNQNRFNRPRWVEEMESTQKTQGESTGVSYGFGN